MKHIGKSGSAIAAAAFALAVSGATIAAPGIAKADDAKVHCIGINSCKGLNSCAGKGFLETTKAECSEKGGTVES